MEYEHNASGEGVLPILRRRIDARIVGAIAALMTPSGQGRELFLLDQVDPVPQGSVLTCQSFDNGWRSPPR